MNGVDKAVGQRIRQRRKRLGLSQSELALRIGVRFQQVQKYESGNNRVAASRLWEISQALGVPIDYFFEDLLHTKHTETPSVSGADTPDLQTVLQTVSIPQKRAILALIRTFQSENDSKSTS